MAAGRAAARARLRGVQQRQCRCRPLPTAPGRFCYRCFCRHHTTQSRPAPPSLPSRAPLPRLWERPRGAPRAPTAPACRTAPCPPLRAARPAPYPAPRPARTPGGSDPTPDRDPAPAPVGCGCSLSGCGSPRCCRQSRNLFLSPLSCFFSVFFLSFVSFFFLWFFSFFFSSLSPAFSFFSHFSLTFFLLPPFPSSSSPLTLCQLQTWQKGVLPTAWLWWRVPCFSLCQSGHLRGLLGFLCCKTKLNHWKVARKQAHPKASTVSWGSWRGTAGDGQYEYLH